MNRKACNQARPAAGAAILAVLAWAMALVATLPGALSIGWVRRDHTPAAEPPSWTLVARMLSAAGVSGG